MKKILIANIFGIGDVLFTTPLISNLKKKDPDIKIDYMCNIRTMDIVNHISGIDDIYVYEKDVFTQIWGESKVRFLKAAQGLFNEIREQKYDVLFDFTLSRELGLFFKLAGIKRRVGLDYKKRGVFLTDKIPFDGFKERHVIEYYLDYLKPFEIDASLKDMKLFVDEISQETILSLLREKGVDENAGPLVAIIPGGGASWGRDASKKRWTADGFAQAADLLMDKGTSVAVLGDAEEADLCRNIAGKMKKSPALSVNNFTLPDYIAFLNACDLVLCNDGGPLHIAGALGVKTVSIFGPVDEKVYGPYPESEDHIVVKDQDITCRPCYNRFKLPECKSDHICFTGVSPEKVSEACWGLII
ncbi:MAG: glycosyltransferase family 9 protein [Candidatus Omnitrophota bacterium]